MNTRAATIAVVSFLLGLAVAAGYPRLRGIVANDSARTTPRASAQARSGNPNELRFEPNAPQLDQIRSSPAVLSEVPLVEPLGARLAYDEDRTTRVSSPIAGRVVALLAKPGDAVKRGQVLARIDSPDFGSAVSDVDKAQADAHRKDLALARSRELYAAGLLAKRDLESAEADKAQADAELKRAREHLANLNGVRRSGARTFDLVAPIAGVVVDRQANPGMEVRPDLQNPLFVVSDLRRLWAILDVPEPALHSVMVGSHVELQVAAYPSREFSGDVQFVSPALDPTTRRVQARVVIDNRDGLLRPEMYAKAIVSTSRGEKGMRVPVSSLIASGERTYVFVDKGGGVFEKREVTLQAQDHDYAYVGRGLEVGDSVVTTGALLLASEAALGG